MMMPIKKLERQESSNNFKFGNTKENTTLANLSAND